MKIVEYIQLTLLVNDIHLIMYKVTKIKFNAYRFFLF